MSDKESIADKLRRKGFPQLSEEEYQQTINGLVQTVYVNEEAEVSDKAQALLDLAKQAGIKPIRGAMDRCEWLCMTPELLAFASLVKKEIDHTRVATGVPIFDYTNVNQPGYDAPTPEWYYEQQLADMSECKTPGIRLKKGDLVHVVAGPHCGQRAFIRLTDGNEALLDLDGRNAGTVVAIEHCEYVGHDASKGKPKPD
jgi:hypothetical protein